MKTKWQYISLDKLCDIINGLWTGKKEPFVNIAVIRNTNFSKDCKLKIDNIAYIDVEVKQLETRKLQYGDIIIEKSGGSEKQPVGRAVLFDITDGDYSFSNFTTTLRIKDRNKILPQFLHKCLYAYYCKGETLKMQSKTTGLHNLNMKTYLRLSIPVPPIAEQERIVRELDLLSGIIDKLRVQLRELDTLAQSIFYSTFGEDSAKRHQWQTCKIGDVYKFQYGKGNKIPENKGMYPCYGSNGIVGYHTEYNSEDSPIIGHIGAYAGIVNWGKGKHFVTYNGVMCWLKSKEFNPIYGFYMLKGQNYLEKARTGVAQPFVSYDALESPIIYIPPIELQNEFAKKIESIEKQKEAVTRSIAEMQKLFDYTMDKYFG